MTATTPGQRTEPPGRAGALALAAALLLAASTLFALPAALFTPAYYTDSWAVLPFVAAASTLTTLVLASAAVARGAQVFLLLVSVGTVLHLVGMVGLALSAGPGPGPEGSGRLWSNAAQLALALACLAGAWWGRSRAERRPWVLLLLLALAPLLGRYVAVGPLGDQPWWPLATVALGLPLALTVLAAGLVCLPGRAPRIAGAPIIVLAGLALHGSHLVLGTQPEPYRMALLALALGCAFAGALARPSSHGDEHPAAPDAETPDTDREVVTTSDTAVVLVPSSRPEVGTASRTLPIAALLVLALTVALGVPSMFAQGPGIRPDGAGPAALAGLLAGGSVPALGVLAAGAATLGSRGMLLAAAGCTGLSALVLLASRAATSETVAPHEALPFAALVGSLVLTWAGRGRPGRGGAVLRWGALAPLVLAAPPLLILTDPNVMVYAGDPTFFDRFVLPSLLPGIAPVVAAALLGLPRRGPRIAAAVLLGLLALGAVWTTLGDASGLRLLAALNLLQVSGYALACVLAVGAAVAPTARDGSVQSKTTSAQL